MSRTYLPDLADLAGPAIAALLAGCLPSGSAAPAVAGHAFPVGVAVASPFSYRVVSRPAGDGLPEIVPQSGAPSPDYAIATDRINDLLRAVSPSRCRFDPALLLSTPRDARCYGPRVVYQGHPDADSPSDPGYDGALPAGDVGLWSSEEPGSGQACAAAELNARLGGVADQSLGALSALASLVCAAIATGQPLPSRSTLDLTAAMNAAAAPGLQFTTATLSHRLDEAGADRYSYLLDFTFPRPAEMGSQVPTGAPLAARVELVHAPAAGDDYLGRLSYQVSGGPLGPGCPRSDGALLGSLGYRRQAAQVTLEARGAAFCGRPAAGFTGGLVDPRRKLDPMRGPEGWSGGFSVLLAAFDPASLDGSYAYAWQAGPMDGHSRVLDVSVAPGDRGEGARAFFGYGADVADPGGLVQGMTCSWAGPRSRHGLVPAAQYQSLGAAAGRGLFPPLASRLRYAPENGCSYDGRGVFRYDSDGDGVADTDPGRPVLSELLPLTSPGADGRFAEISASGFALPAAPPGP